MANCPYNMNGCCTRYSYLMVNGVLGQRRSGICWGKQVDGEKYTNCPYYHRAKKN